MLIPLVWTDGRDTRKMAVEANDVRQIGINDNDTIYILRLLGDQVVSDKVLGTYEAVVAKVKYGRGEIDLETMEAVVEGRKNE